MSGHLRTRSAGADVESSPSASRNENERHEGATCEVRMRLDGKRYPLLAFRVS